MTPNRSNAAFALPAARTGAMKWQMRVGEAPAHELDFGQRRGVEMADAGGPHLVEHERMRIGLHRIQRVARKGVEEALRRGGEPAGMQHIDGLDGFQPLDHLLHAGKARQQRFDARIGVHERRSRIGGASLGQARDRVKALAKHTAFGMAARNYGRTQAQSVSAVSSTTTVT